MGGAALSGLGTWFVDGVALSGPAAYIHLLDWALEMRDEWRLTLGRALKAHWRLLLGRVLAVLGQARMPASSISSSFG